MAGLLLVFQKFKFFNMDYKRFVSQKLLLHISTLTERDIAFMNLYELESEETSEELARSDFGNPEDLSFLHNLIKAQRPQKVVFVGVADKEIVGFLENSYRQTVYIVKSGCAHSVQNLEELLPAKVKEIGHGIDFLIINSRFDIPDEILDFLIVYPFLSQDAIVVLFDTIVRYIGTQEGFASSMLFKNIIASKFSYHREAYPSIKEQFKMFGTEIGKVQSASRFITGFQINQDTHKYIKNIFVSLRVSWAHMPNEENLRLYERIIKENYSLECFQLYKQAVENSLSKFSPIKKFLEKITDSLIASFEYILIFGRKKRGKAILGICNEMGIKISGFIVSDGRTVPPTFEGYPVYNYSQIPYDKNQTLIINTSVQIEVKSKLQISGYHWIDSSNIVFRSLAIKEFWGDMSL